MIEERWATDAERARLAATRNLPLRKALKREDRVDLIRCRIYDRMISAGSMIFSYPKSTFRPAWETQRAIMKRRLAKVGEPVAPSSPLGHVFTIGAVLAHKSRQD